MALRKAFIPKGFTLIEILVVIGMLAIVGGITLVFGLREFGDSSFHNDRNTLVAALQKARSQAVSEICIGAACTGGLPHGVHVASSLLTIFQGTVYDPADFTNETIPAGSSATLFSGTSDIVFAELSGDALATGTVTVSDASGDQSVVTVGRYGQISWTY